MAERFPDRRHRETREGGPRGNERPAEPKNPPGASALGPMPCAKPGAAAPAGVVAPRYRSSRGEDLSSVHRREDRHEGGDDRGRSRSRQRAHRRRRDKALPAEDRREETPPKKKAKRSSAASAAAAPPPA